MLRSAFLRLERNPVRSFIVILLLLFGVIILAAWVRSPKPEAPLPEKTPKVSKLFTVGLDHGDITLSAQVKKSGLIDVVALTSGIVKQVNVHTGQHISATTTLLSLTSDYDSGLSSLIKEEAARRTNFAQKTFGLQSEINLLQKKIVTDNESSTYREERIAKKQNELADKNLELNRKLAALDAEIADRQDAILHPKSMVSGTVEHIAVHPGESVSPGTVLATIRATSGATTIEAAVPKEEALYLPQEGSGRISIDGVDTTLSNGYIGTGENSSGLVTVIYPITEALAEYVPQNGFLSLELPLVSHTEQGFIIPIDTIRSASDKKSVLVVSSEHVVSEKTVLLGNAIGSSVFVKSGLSSGDELVLNPTVLAGDHIEPIR